MKWSLKGEISNDTDYGPPGYIFWYCGRRSQDFLIFFYLTASNLQIYFLGWLIYLYLLNKTWFVTDRFKGSPPYFSNIMKRMQYTFEKVSQRRKRIKQIILILADAKWPSKSSTLYCMAMRVVEFSIEGYKIRKVFG